MSECIFSIPFPFWMNFGLRMLQVVIWGAPPLIKKNENFRFSSFGLPLMNELKEFENVPKYLFFVVCPLRTNLVAECYR